MNKIHFLIGVLLFTLGTCYAQDTLKKKHVKHSDDRYRCVSLAPLYLVQSCLGYSASYEFGLGHNQVITGMVQVAATRDLTKKYYSMEATNDPMFFFEPGIRYYHRTYNGGNRYCFGPSLIVGIGTKSDYSVNYPDQTVSGRTFFGIQLMNTINGRVGRHFYYAFDYAPGLSYYDRANGVTQRMQFINQLAGRIGYCL